MRKRHVIERDIIEQLAAAIVAGNYIETALALVGLTPQQHKVFMEYGQKPNCHPMYKLYYETVTQAEAKLEATLVMSWKTATLTDWKAAQTFLARRFPQRWAESTKVQLNKEGTSTVVHVTPNDLKNLTDEELNDLELLAAKLAKSGNNQDGEV